MTDLAHPTDLEPPQLPLIPSLDAEGLTEEPESFGRQTWQRFREHKLALIGIGVFVMLAALFVLGPILSPYEFDQLEVRNRNASPSWDHPFGTDDLGRDLFVRTTLGGRSSMYIAIVTAGVAVGIGTLFGSLAGFAGGFVDTILSFVINLFLTVPPFALLLVAAIKFQGSPLSIALLIGALSWTRTARIVRAQFFQLREQEFVLAAKAAGAKPGRIIFKHLLPNSVGQILVDATLLVGTAIILESTLSFLGLGVRPPETSLGLLVADAKGKIVSQPSAVLLPGLIITLIVLSINFIGDALRDAVDPKSGQE